MTPAARRAPRPAAARSQASNRLSGENGLDALGVMNLMPERNTRHAPSPRVQPGTESTTGRTDGPEGTDLSDAERRRRRARFLRDLAEARELRDRVQPRRAKTARLRRAMRMRTFRW
ncbi:hypothetical protein GCM10010384_41620 [Streptomyces djakartensis]|uniref:Uncharacterized protein n=2 Tax=Streptomyces djakartensis TaxID=68193 RepID=A0ABQ3A2H5_9ACTN|nr:hypothetical protein GCM10010384_41620 [Streptomyces djakartensis]